MPTELRTLSAIALATWLAAPAAAQTARSPRSRHAARPPRRSPTRRPPGTSTAVSASEPPTASTGTSSRSPCSGSSGSRSRARRARGASAMGLMFGSMDPADDPNIPPETLDLWLPDEEWARLETSFSVTRVFRARERFRPYLMANVAIQRIHPRSALFYNKPPEGLEPGESPTYATNGVGFTIQPGFEWSLGKTLSLDVGGFYTYYNTGSYDMSPLGLPDVDSGVEWGGAGGPRLAALLGDPPRSRPKGDPRRPGHGPAAAAAATRRAPRRLGRAAQLGLGDGRDVRDQLRRLGVQRVRARRELQPDQPPQLLGQHLGRLHLRRQQVQDQPAGPPVQRLDLLQRGARERHRLLGLVGHVDRRRLRLGVLRGDAPHVVQRHGLDRHRGHRPRRGRAPDLLAHPRQHEARARGASVARRRRSSSTPSAASTGSSPATRAR